MKKENLFLNLVFIGLIVASLLIIKSGLVFPIIFTFFVCICLINNSSYTSEYDKRTIDSYKEKSSYNSTTSGTSRIEFRIIEGSVYSTHEYSIERRYSPMKEWERIDFTVGSYRAAQAYINQEIKRLNS